MKQEKSSIFDSLVEYGQKILLPEMKSTFVTKIDFSKFKDETLIGQDKIIKKLDILLTEKDIGVYKGQKEKKLWAIVIDALRKGNLLDNKDLDKIHQLDFF